MTLPTNLPQVVGPEGIAPDLHLEQTDCLLCGSGRWTPVLEAEDGDRQGLAFQVVRCQRCGLYFTNPRPDPVGIEQFYPPGYGPHRRRSRLIRARLTGWLGALFGRDPERHGPAWHGQGRLLDVGCGSGSFLYRMHRRGWSVVGLDVSAQAVDYVRESLRLPAFLGSLPHPSIPAQSFDVVTIWQCLEHVHRPLDLLQAAHRALAPGGRLYVSVPNIAGAPFRWFRGDWLGLDVPRHLIHFAPDTLARMLSEAGFRVEKIRLQRSTAWVCKSARLAHERSRSAPLGWLRVRPLARLASWYAYLRRQSDCLLAVAQRPQ